MSLGLSALRQELQVPRRELQEPRLGSMNLLAELRPVRRQQELREQQVLLARRRQVPRVRLPVSVASLSTFGLS